MGASETDIENILTVLSVVVLADRRIKDIELFSFGKQVEGIAHFLGLEGLTVGRARQFFDHQKDRLAARLEKPECATFLNELLRPFTASPFRGRLYDAMLRIAYSDGEYHTREHAVIDLAAKLWNIEPDISSRSD